MLAHDLLLLLMMMMMMMMALLALLALLLALWFLVASFSLRFLVA